MRRTVLTLVACGLVAGCQTEAPAPGTSPPTFSEEVAPIVFAECAPCHRPGGAAPFALIDYEDVRRRAQQIADVTSSRYMPPWLPEPGHGNFKEERLLTAEEIDTLRRWASSGTPEGNPDELPPVPQWTEGWELGEPDLVVEMAEPYELPAEGGDVFRNFVVPVPLERDRFVQGFEFRPIERRLVHHATITVDPERASRRLDARHPGPGFDGMRAAPGAVMPDGHFLGWTPGKSAFRVREEMSWRLEGGSDLVVQLHMPTTGKPEKVHASIGLFFTDQAPTAIPVTIRLGPRYFEVPAGAGDVVIEDDYVLPVDVEALSIYPHAHYLATEMKAKAHLPDGTERWLIYIREWDFNWQDFYRYREPVRLPKGTRVSMEFTYDNTEDNPRNPSRPPKDVAYGPQSTDEMGDLYLQVLPLRAEDVDVLRSDYTRKELDGRIRELTFRFERNPEDGDALNTLGVVQHRLGRSEEALASFRKALQITSDLSDARFNLGSLLINRDASEAVKHLETVVRTEPDCVDCRVKLGNAFRNTGRMDDAIAQLEKAKELDPTHAWAHYSLGFARQLRGDVDAAIAEYRETVRLDPEDADAHMSLGSILVATGDCAEAVQELEAAARLANDWPDYLARIAWGLTTCRQQAPDVLARAVGYARRAAELTNFTDANALDALATALAASGNVSEAKLTWQNALGIAERQGNVRLAGEIRQKIASLPAP